MQPPFRYLLRLILRHSAAKESQTPSTDSNPFQATSSSHIGTSLDYGHYIVSVRKDNQWEIINDDRVHVISVEDALSMQPYMVTFEKLEEEQVPV